MKLIGPTHILYVPAFSNDLVFRRYDRSSFGGDVSISLLRRNSRSEMWICSESRAPNDRPTLLQHERLLTESHDGFVMAYRWIWSEKERERDTYIDGPRYCRREAPQRTASNQRGGRIEYHQMADTAWFRATTMVVVVVVLWKSTRPADRSADTMRRQPDKCLIHTIEWNDRITVLCTRNRKFINASCWTRSCDLFKFAVTSYRFCDCTYHAHLFKNKSTFFASLTSQNHIDVQQSLLAFSYFEKG